MKHETRQLLDTEAVSVRVEQARDFLAVARSWLEEQT